MIVGTVELAGGPVRFLERGDGRTLLFVHGWPVNANVWKAQLDGLASEFRVIAIDLPGYGRSPVNRGCRSVSQFAALIHSFISETLLRDVFLIGWSMGAGIVMSYCEQYGSESLSAIGIVDDCPRLLPGDGWKLGIDTMFDPAGLSAWETKWTHQRREVIRDLTEAEFTNPANSPDEVGWLIEESMRADPDVALSSLLDAFDCDFREGLQSIAVPALLLYGENSRFTTAANRDYMDAAIPDSHLAVFSNSAHNLMIEEPVRFNEEVAQFARSLPQGSG